MVNTSLARFWVSIEKLKRQFDGEPMSFGVYVIDEENKVAEIDGDQSLRQVLFEVSSAINNKWNATKRKEGLSSTTTATPDSERRLPPLPPGGISSLTDKEIRLYWGAVMPVLLPERKNDMGYETMK